MALARGFDVVRQAQMAPPEPRLSPARAKLRSQALAMVREEALADAAFSYRIVPLEAPAAPVLRAGGEALNAPWLLPTSGQLTALGCCACTLGPAFERRVSELFAQRRPSMAIALDELGNELLFEVSRRAQDRMLTEAAKGGLSVAGELRAGDPGLDISAQGAVLRLASAADIGIRLGEGNLMFPLKSTSMVFGVGVNLPAVTWSRCDTCPNRAGCRVHKRALAAAAA